MSQRSLRVKQIRKELLKEKIAKSLPTINDIVHVLTKYNTNHICTYTYRKFTPIDKTYSFSIYEINSWEKSKGDTDGQSNSN